MYMFPTPKFLLADLILFHFTLLYFADAIFGEVLFFVFLQINSVWQPRTEQVYLGPFFPIVFAHLSLCHILIIFAIVKILS